MPSELESAAQDLLSQRQRLADVYTEFLLLVPKHAVEAATSTVRLMLFIGLNFETEELFKRLCDLLTFDELTFKKEAIQLEKDLTSLLTHYIKARDAYLAKR